MNTKTPIAVFNLNANNNLGLLQQVVVWQYFDDAFSSKISIMYRVETLSPTGVVVAVGEMQTLVIKDEDAILWEVGEVITPAVITGGGSPSNPEPLVQVSPAVIAVGGEIKVPAVTDYTDLRSGTKLKPWHTEIKKMIKDVVKNYPTYINNQ